MNNPDYYLYYRWQDFKRKCYSEKSKDYVNYGARGITLYEPWHNFLQFSQDIINSIGPRPSKEYSIDRINNDGNYEPGNLRWATRLTQANNRRQCITNKLSDQQVWQIKKSKYGGRILSRKFSIAHSTATRIRNGKRKSHIQGPSCSIV